MTTRRAFIVGLAGLLLVTQPSLADTVEAVRGQLESQGFQIVSQRRTLLGRVRIVAERNGLRREVIINPGNGAILRDFTRRLGRDDDDDDDRNTQRSSGSSSAGDDEDDDDDDDGDDGDDDDDDDD